LLGEENPYPGLPLTNAAAALTGFKLGETTYRTYGREAAITPHLLYLLVTKGVTRALPHVCDGRKHRANGPAICQPRSFLRSVGSNEVLSQLPSRRSKERGWGFSTVPPGGETALGISIDDRYRPRAGVLGFDGKMGNQGGFSTFHRI